MSLQRAWRFRTRDRHQVALQRKALKRKRAVPTTSSDTGSKVSL